MSVVYLVRHGQASFGAADYDALSERGIEQSRVLGAALRERAPALRAAVTGGHRRHAQTAEACLAAWGDGAPVARVAPGFDEFDHDEVLVRYDPRYADRMAIAADVMASGDPRRAFQEIFTKAVARWSAGRHDAEYRETWPAFRARCVGALNEVAGTLAGSEVAVVFTSGGPISAVCQALLGLSDEAAFGLAWTLVNGGVTKVLRSSRGLVLSTLNEHAHFEGARRELLTYR